MRVLFPLVLVACSSAEPTSSGVDASSPDDAVSETTNIDANVADALVADTNIATDSFVADTAKKETSSDVAAEAAPVCGDLAQLAPVVTTEYTLDPHPVYTGGTIEDGTYILVRHVRYASTPYPVPMTAQFTLRFIGGVAEMVSGPSGRSQMNVETSGATLLWKATCPTTGIEGGLYNATPTSFEFCECSATKAGGEVLTYQKL